MDVLQPLFSISFGRATGVRSGTYSESLDLFLDKVKSFEQGAASWAEGAGSATVPFFRENMALGAPSALFGNEAKANVAWLDLARGVSSVCLLVGKSLIEPPCSIPLPEIDGPVLETGLPVSDALLLELASSMPALMDPTDGLCQFSSFRTPVGARDAQGAISSYDDMPTIVAEALDAPMAGDTSLCGIARAASCLIDDQAPDLLTRHPAPAESEQDADRSDSNMIGQVEFAGVCGVGRPACDLPGMLSFLVRKVGPTFEPFDQNLNHGAAGNNWTQGRMF